jgi:hypothetical protein
MQVVMIYSRLTFAITSAMVKKKGNLPNMVPIDSLRCCVFVVLECSLGLVCDHPTLLRVCSSFFPSLVDAEFVDNFTTFVYFMTIMHLLYPFSVINSHVDAVLFVESVIVSSIAGCPNNLIGTMDFHLRVRCIFVL